MQQAYKVPKRKTLKIEVKWSLQAAISMDSLSWKTQLVLTIEANGIISETGSIQQLLLDFTVLHILTVHSYPQFYPRKIWSLFSIMRKPYMASFLPWLAPLLAHTGMIPHFFHVFCGSSRVPSCIYWTFTKRKIYIRDCYPAETIEWYFWLTQDRQNIIIIVTEFETQCYTLQPISITQVTEDEFHINQKICRVIHSNQNIYGTIDPT